MRGGGWGRAVKNRRLECLDHGDATYGPFDGDAPVVAAVLEGRVIRAAGTSCSSSSCT